MATREQEVSSVRRSALWFALIGVSIGVILYLVGGNVATFLAGQRSAPTQGALVIQVSNDANANQQHDLAANEHGVGLVKLDLSGPKTVTASTDNSGFSKITNLPPGTYQVSASLRESELAVLPSEISVIAGDISSAELLVNAAGTTLGNIAGALTTLDAAGNSVPITGAEVTLSQNDSVLVQGMTESDGLYEFEGLAAGLYKVRIQLSDERERELTINLRSNLDSSKRDIQFAAPSALMRSGNDIVLVASSSAPGLHVTKLASDADELPQEFVTSQPGASILYSITLRTLGTASDSYPDLKLIDEYPAGISVSGITGAGIDNAGTIVWNLGTVTGGQIIEVQYSGKLAANAADGNYRNVIKASATGYDTVEDDSTVISTTPKLPAGSLNTTESTGGSGTTNVSTSGSTSTTSAQTVPQVGVDARTIALIAALPIAAVATIIGLGLRRASS